MSEPIPDPQQPPAGPPEPIKLPDDHPLVTAFAALKEENKTLKGVAAERDTLAQQLAAVKNEGLPEWQQRINELQEKFDAAEAARAQADEKADKASKAQLRTDRAAAKNLPLAMAKKLSGSTAEEIDAEIDELLPFIGQGGPRPNPQQGTPSEGRGGTLSAGRERYAQTHK